MGECGRYPVAVHACIRAVKYWLKLCKMGDERLPKAALKLQIKIDEQGKRCWITDIKELLYRYGYGFVYLQGEVGDETLFINQLKERLVVHYKSCWLEDVGQNNRLMTYVTFKSLLEPELYLHCLDSMYYRKALARFRCSCHSFLIEKGRHVSIPRQDRLCTSCGVLENEEHVVMCCTKYSKLRNYYLPEITEYGYTFVDIMKCKNPVTIKYLSSFLYAIMKNV